LARANRVLEKLLYTNISAFPENFSGKTLFSKQPLGQR
jgi:hypothetical protein